VALGVTTTARSLPRGRLRRRLRRPSRRRLSRAVPRILAVLGVLALVGFGTWTWLRSSSLVAVRQVRIVGLSGPDADQIRTALRAAARRMTTLDVTPVAFHRIVAAYPVVKRVSETTDFPHGMTISVTEQVPIAQLPGGGRAVVIGSDGRILSDPADTGPLPTLADPSPTLSGHGQVIGQTAHEVELLAAAPYALLQRVGSVTNVSGLGLVAQLRDGPKIVFGSSGQAAAKWAAAAGVLADRFAGQPTAAGADYIDVTDPRRPAAGAGQDTAAGSLAPAGSAAQTVTAPSLSLPGVPATAPGAGAPSGASGTG
jgi:cell division protein FtsQ